MSFFVPGAGGVRPHAEASATLVGAGTAEVVQLAAAEVSLVAPGSMTAGRYGLFRFDLPPGAGGAAPHIHTGFSESFYVLSGTPTLLDGRTWARATTSTPSTSRAVPIPAAEPHGGAGPARDAAAPGS